MGSITKEKCWNEDGKKIECEEADENEYEDGADEKDWEE